MICSTMKVGMECALMTKAGCGFSGGSCLPIVDQCDGCQKVKEFPSGRFCTSFPNPSVKWKMSNCNFATHAKADSQNQQQAKSIPSKHPKEPPKGSKLRLVCESRLQDHGYAPLEVMLSPTKSNPPSPFLLRLRSCLITKFRPRDDDFPIFI